MTVDQNPHIRMIQRKVVVCLFAILTCCGLTSCRSALTQPSSAGQNLRPNEEPSTYCRYISEKRGDMAWENDKVAFRAFGPLIKSPVSNSGIDCWLKRVDYPVINKWYRLAFYKIKSYHEDGGEGHDPYHVGDSAGCGGAALWIDGKRVHLGRFIKHQVHTFTREESSFSLFYEKQIGDVMYTEQRTITIHLGEQLIDITSSFAADGKAVAGLPICIGVTTHDGIAKPISNAQKGWIGCTEQLDGYFLGTAAMINPKRIDRIEKVQSDKTDESHIFIITRTDKAGTVSYRAGYAWERAGKITDEQSWVQYLNNQK